MRNLNNIKITLFRFDPTLDSTSRYTEYSIPAFGDTLLNALLYVLENYDPDLSFRYGCGGSGADERCGSCAVLSNGKPTLACKERITEKSIIVEPHPKFQIVKDLVVDFGILRGERIKDTNPEALPRVDLKKCTGCGACVKTCPMGVFILEREKNKKVSRVFDPGSCCGNTCLQCLIYCSYDAISLVPGRREPK